MKTHSTQTDTVTSWLSSVNAFVLTMILTCCFSLGSFANTTASAEVEVISVEEAELPTCKTIWIKNDGQCVVDIYEWLTTGDIYKATLQPGQTYDVHTCNHSMWRAVAPNWQTSLFDEHWTFNYYGSDTWSIHPNYCQSGGGTADCPVSCAPNVTRECGTSIHPNQTGYPSTTCPDYHWTYSDNSNNAQCPEVITRSWTGTYTGNAGSGNCSDCGVQKLIGWEMENCNNDGNYNSMSEFHPTSYNNGGCASINGSILSNGTGMHSCVDGAVGNTGVCFDAEDECWGFMDDLNGNDTDEDKITFTMTVNPGANQQFRLDRLSFYQQAPTYIDWANAHNNLPTKFGVRVLQNGTEVFKQENYNTTTHWSEKTINLGLCAEGNTTFTFELLGYCANVINNNSYEIWELDHVKLWGGCCSNISYETLTCTQTITVEDTTDPTMTNAHNQTVECNGNGNTAAFNAWLANHGGATASDACTGVTWSTNPANPSLSNDCGATGSATVEFIATDHCGNSTSRSATFTVSDTHAPVIQDADNQTVECDGNGNTNALNAWLNNRGGATANDVCGNFTWSQSPDPATVSNQCGETGSVTVTWTATDDCGNSSSTSATFTIQDTTDPVVTNAQNETVECDGSGNAAQFQAWLNNHGGATKSDVCGSTTWSTNNPGLSNLCGATGSVDVTFTATDDCGNSSSTTATFTIVDTTDPVIGTPASNETVECDGSGNTAQLNAWLNSNAGAAASDVCGNVTWSHGPANLSDLCGATGSVDVTFTATDDCGNTATTQATFTIEDTTDPAVTPASNQTVECDGNGNTAQLNAWLSSNGGATASDACGNVTWSNDAGNLSNQCAETGAVLVTFTATDECGNTSSTNATFTIEDTTNPAITNAQNETVECDGSGNTAELNAWLNNNGGATASDICGNVTWSNNAAPLSNECGATGDVTVTFTATDDCGLSSSTTATFTVVDTTNPAITDAAPLTVECDGAGNTADLNAWLNNNGGATANDVCGNVTWSHSPANLTDECGATGETTVTFTATDDCGNSSSTTATFIIEDTTDPVLTAPADETVECDGAGNQAALTAWLANNAGATASDVCGGVTWTHDFNGLSDDCGATGTALVVFTATDDCGNSDTVSATFTIVDTTDPTITAASDQTVECDGQGNQAEYAAWLASNGGATGSDVCGSITWSNNDSGLSDLCGATGTADVTFTATDECGNTSSTTATFTIVDTTDPAITDASNETVECDGNGNQAEYAAWLANNGGATASDICGGVTWSNNDSGLTDECGATGEAVITFTATDECGNTSSTTATFTIVDTTDPAITPASDETVECDGAGNQGALATWLSNNGGATASDVCSDVVWSNDFNGLSDDCGATGDALVTFTATDDCGNSSSVSATFTIVDTTNPVITDAADQTVECDGAGNTAELAAWVASQGGATASDVCGDVVWTNTPAVLSDECGATGETTVTFTATDDCGNMSSTTATFTIIDTTDPEVTAPADETVECDGAGNTAALQAWLASNGGATASDICGSVTWTNTFNALSDDCGATGTATVDFTATDECNNSVTVTATFTIVDTTDPAITDAADETVECDGNGNQAAYAAWLASNGGATGSDICGSVTWSNDDSGLSDDCGATGSSVVTFTATDECGNTSSTTATFTIEDTTDPVVTDATDETVECDGAGNTAAYAAWLANNGGATGSDVCSDITWTNDDSGMSDDCGATGTSVITFTATDDCGNSSSTTATFTIVDTVDPLVTAASDETVECDGSGNQAALTAWLNSNGGATGSDDCSDVVWSNDFTSLSDDCGETGTALVTFTATDDCGNSTSTSASFTIVDTTDPAITDAADMTVECDGSGNQAELDAWLANQGGATVSDDCGDVTWSNLGVVLSDDCGATGTVDVTFIATDDCGNTSETTATFTIEDTTAPVISTPADNMTVECDGNGNAAAYADWLASNGGAVVTDACSDVVWTNDSTGLSDECGETGEDTVTFTATDDCGNTSTTTATFTIVDTLDPAVTPAVNETVECDGMGNTAAYAAWLANNGGATATDACSDVVWTNDGDGAMTDECGETGFAMVTFTATDDCGNSTSTTATFTIEDTTAPVMADANDMTVECDGMGNNQMLQDWLDANGGASATEDCGEVTYSNDYIVGGFNEDCGATGSVVVTFTATDDCGNTDTATATFTIEDTTAPTMDTMASDATVECDGAGNQAAYDAWLSSNGGAAASDACSDVTWTNDAGPLSDECGETGSAEVTFTATDACGNETTTTATFTIEDTTPPVVECVDPFTVQIGSDGVVTISVDDIDNGSSDLCSDDANMTYELDVTEFTMADVGTNTVKLTVTDECGNMDMCTTEVTVVFFDLALNKVLAAGEDETVYPGDIVTFYIEVFNQGTIEASNIVVTDYLPAGMALADPNWAGAGSTASITIPGPLAPGASTTVSIDVEITATAPGQEINRAEISDADAEAPFAPDDIDSDADGTEGNDAGGEVNSAADDFVDGDGSGAAGDGVAGTDEDDEDPEDVTVEIFDLALIIELGANEADNNVYPGEDVTFTITVENQGTVTADNIDVISYLPDWFELNDAAWTDIVPGPSGEAGITLPGQLVPGQSTTVDITVTVTGLMPGATVPAVEIIVAEIAAAEDLNGDSPTDIDSTPDTTETNDAGGQVNTAADDFLDGDGTGAPGDGVAATDEDDQDPEDVILQIFDLALSKVLAAGEDERVYPGEDVTFDIEVTNQGTVDASNIVITDYIPAGLGGGTQTLNIAGPLAPGASEIVSITLTAGSTPGQEVNRAEITSAEDPAGDMPADIDSTPDAVEGNDAGGEVNSGADDFIDGDGTGAPGDGVPGTDEDDEDPEDITIEIFDLALIIELGANEADNNVYPGEDVTFTITVENQGTVTADNIDVISYLPDWFVLNDANWTDIVAGPSGEAGITLPGTLAPGASTTVDITVTVTGLMPGMNVPADEIIVAEIAAATDDLGGTPTDIDSIPDTTENNDAGGLVNSPADDFLGGDGTGIPGDGTAATDEDDQDPEDVVVQVFDLALIKVLAAGEDATVYPGEDITFDIEVTNQGTVAASNIVITDYIPAGLGGGTQTLNIAGPLAPGASEIVSITLTAGSTPGDEVNRAEITSAEDPAGDMPADIDSTPDAVEGNDAGGAPDSPSDNVVDGDGSGAPGGTDPATDEDDEDPEQVTIEVFDLALVKTISTPGPYYPGMDITFQIEVTNQGTVPASNVAITDYAPAGLGGGTQTLTIAGPIAPGASETVDVTYTITATTAGQEVNVAEIASAEDPNGDSPDDLDSTPDTDPSNDAGGQPDSPADDAVDGDGTGAPGDNNPATDEDDSDPAAFDVDIFDLALIIELGAGEDETVYPGEDVTFTITVENQGTVPADMIDVISYLPDWFELNDADWADIVPGPSGEAGITLPGTLAPGASTTVDITVTVTGLMPGATVPAEEIIVAEIAGAEDTNGNAPTDIDSVPDSVENNDAGGLVNSPADDFLGGDGTGAPGDGTAATDEDDQDPEDVTLQIFDLALVKELAAGQDATVYPGEDVVFDITVTNQGTVDARNIVLTDYIPAGFGGGTQTLNIAGPLAPGASETVSITLTAGSTPGTEVNRAEITSAEDPNGDSPADVDSTPDDTPGNDAGGAPDSPSDDVVDGDGTGAPGDTDPATDEDDEDPEQVVIEVFDLALTKVVAAGQPTTFYPGMDITFTIEVFNQGTVPASNVQITDSAPASLGGGSQTLTIAGPIAPGGSATVDVTYTISGTTAGNEVNVAEILSAEDPNGDMPTDLDSVPDSDPTNDAGGNPDSPSDDAVDGDGSGAPGDSDPMTDEDDSDPASFDLEVFDLALTKVLAAGEDATVYVGEDVTFTIEVTNQGSVAASNIEIIDYIPAGFGGGTQTLTIAGPIAPGASATIDITLTAGSNPGTEVNVAEIVSAEDPNGNTPNDLDSTPDTIPGNDAGGAPNSPSDNVIGGDGTGTPGDTDPTTDEDDQDPEEVVIEVFDLALTKVVAPGQASVFYPGDDVEFIIEVVNQGTVAASNIEITDYAPAGLGGGTQTLTIAGPIAPGASEQVTVTLTVTATDAGQEVNVAEITSAEDPDGNSPGDADSTPDTDPTNDAGGAPDSPSDDATNGDGSGAPGDTDPTTDEDDSDPAAIDVEIFDLALLKSLSGTGPFYVGEDVTFTIEVINQGTVAASNVTVIDYIPAGFTLNDPNWTAAGGNATTTVAGPIAPGGSTTVDIILTLGGTAGDFENIAEITGAEDPDGNTPADQDSTPDDDPTNDPTVDGEIDNAGGDEDDSDPEPITVDVFDLALSIVLDPSEADTDVYPGEDVTFLVEVTNQGTVTAANIDVVSYLPDWFVLNDADWSDVVAGPGGTAGITIPGILAPGASVQVPITVTVTPVMAGAPVPAEEIIVAEISGATDQSGNTPTDVDSTPDAIDGNDAGGQVNSPADDFIDGDGTGAPGSGTAATDEDDNDPEDVTVQVFDLALTKKLAAGQSENVYPGQDVEFVIEVTNQGTVPASNIVISDYAPAGLGGGTQTLTIAGPIAPGASADVTITLPVTAAVAGQEVNVAEITSAEDGNGDSPADADSNFDSNPNNDAGGQVNGSTDDTINNENGDEDDSDPEDVTVEIFDLALIKSNGTPAVIYPGADVTYSIEVFNQGTVAAQNVEVIDYIPAGFSLNDANWTAAGGNATTTIANIPVGGSIVVSITLTAGDVVGDFDNFAEITSAEDPNGFAAPDADSTPDANNGNDTLVDDEIANGGDDEDDHDVGVVTVEPCPEATISGETVINCYEPSVDLTADGGVAGETYAWTGPAGFTSTAMTITVSAPGTYTVVITNPANGCTDEADIVVTEDLAEPDAAAAGGEMTCIVTEVTLDGSSSTTGVTYAWTGPAGFTSSSEDPTVSVAGTYTLVVTSTGNGCSTTVTTEVTEDITPPDATADGGEITCNFTSVTLMGNTTTAGASFSWTGPGGFTSSVQNPSVSVPGNYTLTVTGLNGCTALASATVTEDTAEPNVSAEGGLITCNNGTAQICASSTTADVTYRWSGPDGIIGTDACANVTTGGAYTILVTGPNGCTNSMTVIVEVDITPPNAEATGGEITCSTGTVTINGSSSTAGATYSWSGPGGFISTAPSASVSAPGNYILTVTGPNGCTAEATAVVTSDTTAPDASAAGGTITCSTTSVTLTGSSNTAGVTYAWTGPAGYTSTAQNPSVSAGGTYTLTVTAPNGCTETATATVTMDNAAPVASATGGTISCNQTSITINGSANVGVTYSWTGPAGFTSTAASPSVTNAGVYTLTVTAANGCTDTAEATVVDDTTPPTVSCTGGTITCGTPSVTMTSTTNIGGAAYSWTGPNGFTSTDANPVVTEPGNYVVTVTGANGCSASSNCEVFADNTPPTVSCVGGTISCANGSASLTASGTGIASFSWTGPNGFTGTGASVTGTEAGVYTVTATATNGCTATSQCEIVSDSTPPTVSCTAGEISCTNASAALTATGNGASYSWTGPNGFTATGANASTTVAGVYTVTAVGANGCSSQSSCTVTADLEGPQVSCSAGSISCANPTATLTVTGNATSYSWTGPNGPLGNGTSIDVSAPGEYTVTGYSANGCSNSSTCTVTGDTTPPSVTCTGGTISCANPTATVSANAVGAVSYAWSGPSGPIAGSGASINVSEAGDYTVTVTAANGCTAISSCTVTGDTIAPTVSCTGGTISCANPTATVTASATGAASYSWSGPAGPIAGNAASITVSAPGDYTVTVTSANGCTASSSCTVTGDTTAPTVSCTGGTISCASPTTTVTASATGAASYSWSGPAGPIAGNTASITVSAAGNYTVTVTSANGCTASSSCTVTGDTTAPTVSCTGGTISCANPTATVTANATGAASYSWSGPNGPIAGNTASITANVAGSYTVTVTSANGCTATSSCSVAGDTTAPTVSCTGGTISCTSPSTTVTASATGATSYSWSGPTGPIAGNTASITVSAAGNYTVTVTSANGCTASSSCTVTGDTTAPTVSCTGGTISCTNPTTIVSASATGAASYSWSGPSGPIAGNTASITASAAGNYTVTVTAANGCTATSSCVVTGDTTAPTVYCTGGTLDCNTTSTSVTAVATGAVAYSWSGPSGPIAGNTATISVSAAGNYTVTVTSANGCTASSTCSVSGDTTVPTVSCIGGSISCASPTTSVTASATGASSYSWSGPNGPIAGNVASITANVAGTYTVTVFGANGCSATSSCTVSGDTTAPQVSCTGGTITCASPTTTVSASAAAGSTYNWTGPNGGYAGNTAAITASVAGNYTVTVTGSNGCTAQAVCTVTGSTAGPSVSCTGGTISCTSPTVTVSANAVGATSYSWSGPNGPIAGNAASITASEVGIYTVTVTDANGCSASSSCNVVGNAVMPECFATGGSLTCDIFNVVLQGGSNALNASYSWTGPNGYSSNEQNPLVSQPGIYTLTVTTGPGCTCSTQAQVYEDNQGPALQATGGTLGCNGSSAQLNASTANDAVIEFSWSGPNGFTSNISNPTVSVAGNYVVTATNVYTWCASSMTVTVVDGGTGGPAVTATGGTISCTSPTVTVSASSPTGVSYSWIDPAGNPAGNAAAITASYAGNYTVTVTDASGCSSTAVATVTGSSDAPTVSATVNSLLNCNAPSVQVFASSTTTGSYTWSGPNGFTSSEQNPFVSAPGTYSVTVTSGNGCTGSALVSVAQETCIDLELSKKVDLPTCFMGDILTYTIAVTNNGPGNATNVYVLDQLPGEVLYLESTASQGSYDVTTGFWQVGNVPAGAEIMLEIVVYVTDDTSPIVNFAQVHSAGETDIDSVPGNAAFGATMEDDEGMAMTYPQGGEETTGGSGSGADGTGDTDGMTDDGTTGMTDDGMSDGGDTASGGSGGDTVGVTDSDTAGSDGMTDDGGDGATDDGGDDGSADDTGVVGDDTGAGDDTGVVVTDTDTAGGDDTGVVDPTPCGTGVACTEEITPIEICPDFCTDGLAVTDVETTYHCSWVINDNGCITYTPLPGMSMIGSDTVVIIGCDAAGNCEEFTVAVQVGGCADACSVTPAVIELADGGDAATVCAGSDDIVSIVVANAPSGNTDGAFVITDATGTEILAGPLAGPNFDFADSPAGTCLIWHVSWDTNINIPSNMVADITGDCVELSNAITVVREECAPDPEPCDASGQTYCASPAIPIEICPDFCTVSNYEITSVEAIYLCSIALNGECFTYTALPAFMGDEMLTVTACEGDICEEIVVAVGVVADCGEQGTATAGGDDGGAGDDTGGADDGGDDDTGGEEPCTADLETCTTTMTPVDVCVSFCDADLSINAITSDMNAGITQLNPTCFRFIPLPNFSGVHTLMVTGCNDAGDCETAEVVIDVNDDCTGGQGAVGLIEYTVKAAQFLNPLVKSANAFSPNQDGINDVWKLGQVDPNLYGEKVAVSILDQNGQVILQGTDDVEYMFWDGTMQNGGTDVPEGTYFFVLEMEINGMKIIDKGFIELKR